MHVFLGLCSNLGDRSAYFMQARDLLMKHGVMVVGQSEERNTPPLGGLDQPDYLNQVIECITDLEPEALLAVCKEVETEMGRPKKELNIGNVQFGHVEELPLEQRWESRIIDIDILYYGERVVDTSTLTIPHAGAVDRIFELQGMCDLAPDFVHPILKRTMKALLEESGAIE